MPNESAKPVLSIIVPCYNEAQTVEQSLRTLLAITQKQEKFGLEVIAVDDCSYDQTPEILTALAKEYGNLRIVRHEQNQGKGAALKTGFRQATGQWVGIHDADLEYNPEEFVVLIEPLMEGKADIVYGSRFLGRTCSQMNIPLHSWLANHFLTWLTNRLTGLALTDMETCYKICRKELLDRIDIREYRFGVEPEMTCKLAHLRTDGARPVFMELPIVYHPRSYAEGKKIGLKDGLRAIYCIIKYGLLKQ